MLPSLYMAMYSYLTHKSFRLRCVENPAMRMRKTHMKTYSSYWILSMDLTAVSSFLISSFRLSFSFLANNCARMHGKNLNIRNNILWQSQSQTHHKSSLCVLYTVFVQQSENRMVAQKKSKRKRITTKPPTMYMSVSACFVCYLENNKTGNEKCCSAPSNQVTHKHEKSDEEDTNKQTKKKQRQ